MLIHTAHCNSHHQDEYIFNENSPNNFHFATVTGWGIDPTFCVSISFCRLGWNREEPCAWGSWIQSVTGSEKITATGEMSRCAYNCCKSVVTVENNHFENIMFGTFSIYMHRTCYFDVCFQYELSFACVEFDWGVVGKWVCCCNVLEHVHLRTKGMGLRGEPSRCWGAKICDAAAVRWIPW